MFARKPSPKTSITTFEASKAGLVAFFQDFLGAPRVEVHVMRGAQTQLLVAGTLEQIREGIVSSQELARVRCVILSLRICQQGLLNIQKDSLKDSKGFVSGT